jgi:hypothetical protein
MGRVDTVSFGIEKELGVGKNCLPFSAFKEMAEVSEKLGGLRGGATVNESRPDAHASAE